MEKASELLGEGVAEPMDFSVLVGASSWLVSLDMNSSLRTIVKCRTPHYIQGNKNDDGLYCFSFFLLIPSIFFPFFLPPSPSLDVTQTGGHSADSSPLSSVRYAP